MNEHCGCEDTAVKELESGLRELSDTSYGSIDKLMKKIMKKYDMTAKQLHNTFVDKHNKTPDSWIKGMKESLEVAKQGLEGKRYCKLCRKSETAQDCKFGVDMWNKYSIATVHPGNMPEQSRYPKSSTIEEKNSCGASKKAETEFHNKLDKMVHSTFGKRKAEKEMKEDHVAIAMGKMLDDEGSMVMSQLDQIEMAVANLRKVVKDPKMQLPAWVQSKITVATDYIDTAADYMSSKNEEFEIEEGAAEAVVKVADWVRKGPGRHADAVAKHQEKQRQKKIPYAALHAEEAQYIDEKRGLWDNIHARRKAGKPPKKPGEKGYPKTLDIDEGLKQARKNVGASKCWTGKVAKGTKMKGGREVPNCVPANEDTCSSFSQFMQIAEAKKVKIQTTKPIEWKIEDIGPDKKVVKTTTSKGWKNEEVEIAEVAAWQRKEGKNPSGGLNEKGRKSYEAEHPGSDLKPPQPEGGPRQRSFCARMSGMPGPMKDEKGRPTRKALSLRKWHCGKK